MKKSHLLILLSSLIVTSSFAAGDKAIYRWEQGGLVHYSHIKPIHVENVTKLDSSGREIEDYTEDFGEIVQIVVRPPAKDKKQQVEKVAASAEEIQKAQEKSEKETRKKNCEIANTNLKTINTGEVYETNAKGEKVRLTPEQLEVQRKNTLFTEFITDLLKLCDYQTTTYQPPKKPQPMPKSSATN